ncbi:type I-E CRISPR-associated protein Cas6/Cse3/CasE [Streptomyces sp. NPDC093149]|uniref:type I-E CRISPR-associated protein Cas6/Cse3/CasE n=1 Tax=Streptomyces sp. NPDC093149 TaxID=3366031 RepID=UPI0037F9179D
MCDDVHRLHLLVLSGFSNQSPGTTEQTPRPAQVLYAARRGTPQSGRTRRLTAAPPEQILVQAPLHPNWEPLRAAGRLIRADVFPVEHHVTTGDIIDIQVIANPVRRDTLTGKRVSVATPDEASRWLHRRLACSGLETSLHHIDPGERIRMTGTRTQSGDRITALYREMTARSRVLDPALLAHALEQGVGPAKAYGCGLLRIHQVR